jgi:hypothetical protein
MSKPTTSVNPIEVADALLAGRPVTEPELSAAYEAAALALHPTIDEAAAADEAAYWVAERARQDAADELVQLDLDRWADERAEESAWMDAYERGNALI